MVKNIEQLTTKCLHPSQEHCQDEGDRLLLQNLTTITEHQQLPANNIWAERAGEKGSPTSFRPREFLDLTM